MTDDPMMRFRLQQVLAYRSLCGHIRSSGRSNVFFALLFLAFAYMSFRPNAAGALAIIYVVYGALALAEIAVGLLKWFFPSAEGVLFDAMLLFLFAGLNLGVQGLAFALGARPQTVGLVVGVFLLFGSFRRFKNYLDLRRLFADRPSREQLAWFDDLIYEIRHADPATDDLALDLPTRPHWKAKLLGATAFFVAKRGSEVLIAGPYDFGLT
ncbi:MAG TPA: hypothetical protein VGL71_05660, partial [Urbifossiella sp.]